jgi:hypothetical protein
MRLAYSCSVCSAPFSVQIERSLLAVFMKPIESGTVYGVMSSE